MSELSLFHSEMLQFLQTHVAGTVGEKDVPRSLLGALDSNSVQGFDDIVRDVQMKLTGEGGAIDWKWIHSFSLKEFIDLGLEKYYPKIYRGLPRLYHRDNPARSIIKKNFRNLSSLKQVTVERAVASLYPAREKGQSLELVIFVWVIPDGLGDWIAALETARLIQEQMEEISIKILAVTSREIRAPEDVAAEFVYYKDTPASSVFSDHHLKLLRNSDLILQIPTFFPETAKLFERLKQVVSAKPFPLVEGIGEYGYLESSWFHPNSSRRSMGLHALEMGIFIKSRAKASFLDLECRAIAEWILGTQNPSSFEIDQYRMKTRFHFAYLFTPQGGAIYLRALMKMWEGEQKGIDLCTPDLGWFIQAIQQMGEEALFASFAIQRIEVKTPDTYCQTSLREEGKVIRIFCTGLLSQQDLKILMALSDGWVGVRGDQSFSEAVAHGKPFFYDGREHARYFMKDFLALAQNRLRAYPSALSLCQLTVESFLYQLPEESEEWVDETFFQLLEKRSWEELAQKIGQNLQRADTMAGFQKLSQIILEEYSFNSYLIDLVRRAQAHRLSPSLKIEEQKLLGLYGNGQNSLSALVKNLQVCMMRL